MQQTTWTQQREPVNLLTKAKTSQTITNLNGCFLENDHDLEAEDKMATQEFVAAGFIVFRRLQCQIQYLIMKHSYGDHWSPPKGTSRR